MSNSMKNGLLEHPVTITLPYQQAQQLKLILEVFPIYVAQAPPDEDGGSRNEKQTRAEIRSAILAINDGEMLDEVKRGVSAANAEIVESFGLSPGRSCN